MTAEDILSTYAQHYHTSGPGPENRLTITYDDGSTQTGYIVVSRNIFCVRYRDSSYLQPLSHHDITTIEHASYRMRAIHGILYTEPE